MSLTSLHHTECEVFSALCWKIGTPVAYKALQALKRDDWLWLVSIKVRPADYLCAKTYLGDAQIAAFFKKFKGFTPNDDLKRKAELSFFELEAECYQTNERLSPLFFDLGHYGLGVKRLVVEWRKEIRSVLRKAPSKHSLAGRFGPGSTFLNQADDITIAHKLSDGYSSTQPATSFLHSWDMTAWSRYAACGLDTVGDNPVAEHHGVALYPGDDSHATRDFRIVRGNRFTTVPKDATKHRGICVEPSLNSFFQLSVGHEIAVRMKKSLGWDKSSCQDFHKNLARIGSLTGAVSTIDLSSASDTVCRNLVKLLLPADWYSLVDCLRSSHTFISKRWVRLEKFSSMGNGYTFELETLLFYTLCRAIAHLEGTSEDAYTPGLTISVFGDDIIVPTSNSSSAVKALKFFGFTPNESKTFLSGSFRESCGGDYMGGLDVRPHFQKETCIEPAQLIALANGIRRFDRRYDNLSGKLTTRTPWFRCIDAIPRQISICRGPESLGDLVIHDDESQWLQRNPVRVRNSIRYLRVWRPVPNRVIGWDHFRPGVVMSVALYGGSSGTPSIANSSDPMETLRRSGVVPRINGSYISGYRFGRVAYS